MVGVDGGVSVDLQRVDVVTAEHRIKHWTSKNTNVPDPCNFRTNPDPWILDYVKDPDQDPALCFIVFQDVKKKNFLSNFFRMIYFTSVFKDKKSSSI